MSQGKFNNPVIAALSGFYDLFRKQELAPRFKDTDSFNGKTVLVTGANSGLGFALSVEAAKRGAKVVMGCRSEIPEAGERVKKLSGSSNVQMRYVDFTKINTIHDFVQDLQNDGLTLDVAILNAASAATRSRKSASARLSKRQNPLSIWHALPTSTIRPTSTCTCSSRKEWTRKCTMKRKG